ncbi:MAG: L-glutamate gamma-semialdehyde dehydrogenase [Planctomycetes bacterium]|nr:L-glutamate gamma-semialdehyde dehydrogenase [Planctomycetota bacterium]
MTIFRTPDPKNEPVRSYAPGSSERQSLQATLAAMQQDVVDIALVIGGEEIRTGKTVDVTPPHDHRRVVARCHQGDASHVDAAIAAARAAAPAWRALPWEQRAAVFLKAADLLAGPWRDTLNAATMIGQGKNCFQAEIDSACELIDFWRFNCRFAQEIYAEQPESSAGCWNRLAQRPLEGFVFAVTPFNFTAIAGNLPTAPALMGNTVVWKPASSAVYSAWFLMKLLEAAGLPKGVINLVHGSGSQIGPNVIASPELAGVHFTGSTGVFQGMWKEIGNNIARYKSYPRLVGETGGKDFVFAHPSADRQGLVTALVRGAFEYQGQKCSAASRAYVPRSMFDDVLGRMQAELEQVKMGPVEDFSNFVNAVIDRHAFKSITEYVDFAKSSRDCAIVAGGGYDDSQGWFIQPTVIVAERPDFRTMCEEIFGPVLTLHSYDDDKLDETLDICDRTSPYALTGAIFAQDRQVIDAMARKLENAAGNFYVNDKPTGAVVGQQPFGGARASGTNDKAGSKLNLLRWCSPRTIKETFCPPQDWRYPFLG